MQVFSFLSLLVAQVMGFCSGTEYCVYAKSDAAGATVFTVHASASGYASFGLGTRMRDSYIIVGWPVANGYAVSERTGSGHSLPSYVKDATQVALAVPAPSWAKIAFSVSVKDSDSGATPGRSNNFIWGSSNTKPNSQSASGSFRQHSTYDSFSAVIEGGTKPSSTSRQYIHSH